MIVAMFKKIKHRKTFTKVSIVFLALIMFLPLLSGCRSSLDGVNIVEDEDGNKFVDIGYMRVPYVERTFWGRVVEFFQSIGWEFWVFAIPIIIVLILLIRKIYKSLVTPDMTAVQKFGVFIEIICLIIAFKVMIDIIWNLAGYNKKK